MASENEVRTRLTVLADGAVAGIRAANNAATGLLRQLGAIKNIAVGASGIGGLFAFHEAAADADRLYATITRLRAVTGASVSSLDAMVDVLEKGGVEGEQAEQVILRMTKGLQSAAGAAALTGEQSSELRRKFQLLGIDIKQGPQAMLVQMAQAAQKGRLQAVDLMKLFRMGPEQAAQMMTMLKEGPQAIKSVMDAQLSDSSRITAQSLQQYQQMLKAKRLAKDAIGDTFSIVYRTFFPTLTKFFEQVNAALSKWQPQIQRAMDYLTSHMDQVVRMIERIAAISAANNLAEMLTGKGLGGLAMSAGKGVAKIYKAESGAISGGAAAAGAMGPLGPVIVKIATAFAAMLGTVQRIAILGAGISAVVATVIAGVKLVATNWNGIRDSLMETFSSIWRRLQVIGAALWKPFAKIGEFMAKVVLVAFDKLVWVVDKILWVVEKIAWLVDKIGDAIGKILGGLEGAVSWVASKIGLGGDDGTVDNPGGSQAWRTRSWNALFGRSSAQDVLAQQRKVAESLPTKDVVSQSGVYQDFRGSKFEVKQEFAEGFDADKVVVAMANRVASLGERRLTSGLAPLYGVR